MWGAGWLTHFVFFVLILVLAITTLIRVTGIHLLSAEIKGMKPQVLPCALFKVRANERGKEAVLASLMST